MLASLALAPALAHALIPEPPHVIRGAVTVNGAPRTWGTVTLRLEGSAETITSFPLGTLPGMTNGYALAVPMNALDPRAPNTARAGDAAQLYLDVALIGRASMLLTDEMRLLIPIAAPISSTMALTDSFTGGARSFFSMI